MTIVSELKKIFKKLSGTEATGHTTDEVLSEIAEVVGEGSSSGTGLFVVNELFDPVEERGILDSTAKEIMDHLPNVTIVSEQSDSDTGIIRINYNTINTMEIYEQSGYVFYTLNSQYFAPTEDDYPIGGSAPK